MSLKRIGIKETEPKKAKSAEMIHTMDDRVPEFVALDGQLKQLQGRLDVLKEEIKGAAVHDLLVHNHSADVPAKSVRINGHVLDAKGKPTGDLAEAVVSYQNKYSVANADAVSGLFDQLEEDVNDYMHEVPAAKFDSSIFLVNGEFDQKVFDAINTAIKGAVTKLISRGKLAPNTGSPLSVTNGVIPKENFHADRFKTFTPEQNELISTVVTNTVTIKASSPKKEKGKAA